MMIENKIIIPELNTLNKNTIREKYISNHYKEFYELLNTKYPNSISFIEKLYWYYNNINEIPVCPICGNHVKFYGIKNGYSKYCCLKCSNNSNETKEKFKKTIIDKYGSLENYSKSQKIHTINNPRPTNPNKAKQTCLERYGVTSYSKTDEYKERYKKSCLEKYGVTSYTKTDEYIKKTKRTKKEKYGNEKFVNTEKIKQTCLERYGVDNFSKTEAYKKIFSSKQKEIQQKIYKTKKHNKTFNTSSIEKQFEAYLKENNINYKTQYKSELYPFCCDFYFPDNDLYLEINAHWTHGYHPFDSTNKDDLLLLERWKKKNTEFYNTAVIVWTVRDVLKRETAKKNNLNYLEVFSNNIEDLTCLFITN